MESPKCILSHLLCSKQWGVFFYSSSLESHEYFEGKVITINTLSSKDKRYALTESRVDFVVKAVIISLYGFYSVSRVRA